MVQKIHSQGVILDPNFMWKDFKFSNCSVSAPFQGPPWINHTPFLGFAQLRQTHRYILLLCFQQKPPLSVYCINFTITKRDRRQRKKAIQQYFASMTPLSFVTIRQVDFLHLDSIIILWKTSYQSQDSLYQSFSASLFL